MGDETTSDDDASTAGDRPRPEEARPSGPRPQRPQPEGVRIIGATEAAAPSPGAAEPELPLDSPRAGSRSAPRSSVGPDTVSEIPAVAPEESFELPHYSGPPTGQVPRVVIGEETDASWSGLADQPRWRDTEHHFDEQAGFGDLVGDEPRLGALGETGEHRDLFDEIDEIGAVAPVAGAGAAPDRGPRGQGDRSDPTDLPDPADLPEPRGDQSPRGQRPARDDRPAPSPEDRVAAAPPVRRPPGPRRRRPPTAAGGVDAPRRAPGADGGGGERNLPMAVAVGVALLAVGIGCFALGSFATMLLITVVVSACAAELFTALTRSGYRPAGLLGVAAVAGLCIAPLYQGWFAYPVILGLATMAGLAWFLFVQPGEGAVMNLGVTLLGIVYVGGLGSFATLLLGVARPYEGSLSNQGIGILIAAVLVTVCYDVGAYFVGRQFGHTSLNAASPNKTQEGLVGGIAAGVVVPALIIGISGLDPVGVDWKTTFGFTLICALMAPVGDLCESAIKRDLGVKDMGTLLPGHGGVLDRFDAMLFVLPTAYFMAHLLSLGKPAFF